MPDSRAVCFSRHLIIERKNIVKTSSFAGGLDEYMLSLNGNIREAISLCKALQSSIGNIEDRQSLCDIVNLRICHLPSASVLALGHSILRGYLPRLSYPPLVEPGVLSS